MRLLIGGVVALGVLAATMQAQACIASHWEVGNTASVIATSRLEVPAGAACTTAIAGAGRTNVRIDQQPAHGSLDLTEEGYVYTANVGYAGLDAFRLTWLTPGVTTRHGMEVLVTIVPPRQAAGAGPAPTPPATDPAIRPRLAKPTNTAYGPDGLGLYGMLVYSRESRTYGFSLNRPSVDAALQEALRQCGRGDCVVMTPMRSQECVAFAVGDTDRYWLRTRIGDPTARALEGCGRRTTNCQLVVTRCM
jgi:hypothetical protein